MQRAHHEAESVELKPDRTTKEWLANAGIELSSQTTFARLTQRPTFDVDAMFRAAAAHGSVRSLADAFSALSEEEREGVINQLRYAGYLERQGREAAKLRDDEDLRIPLEMTYSLPGLSREVTEKLTFVRPVSLGQATRIPGVTPAAIAILRLHLRRGRNERAAARAV